MEPAQCRQFRNEPSGDRPGGFTVQEVVAASQANPLRKPFTSSHISQMLSTLAEVGLVYKNRHGKYSLAVPLLGEFIQRQSSNDLMLKALE
jgi:DNA-binding IclR family transcriptional regulator